MSIVTNQGKVWTISKTSRFDYDAAFAELRKYRGAAEKEWDDVIDNFLKNGYARAKRVNNFYPRSPCGERQQKCTKQ